MGREKTGGDLRAHHSIGIFTNNKQNGKMLAMSLALLIDLGVLQRVEDDEHLKLLFENRTEIIWDASLKNMCAQKYDFIFIDEEIGINAYVDIADDLLKPSCNKEYSVARF